MAQEKYGQLFGSNPACLIMNTQQQPTYDELCHLLGSAIGKPEMAGENARIWTFTSLAPPQYASAIMLPTEAAQEMFRNMVLARLRAVGFVEVTG